LHDFHFKDDVSTNRGDIQIIKPICLVPPMRWAWILTRRVHLPGVILPRHAGLKLSANHRQSTSGRSTILLTNSCRRAWHYSRDRRCGKELRASSECDSILNRPRRVHPIRVVQVPS
jgi:hypothetical protein